MSEPAFVPLQDADREAVLAWVSSRHWPFHSVPAPSVEQVAEAWDDEAYIGPDVRGFWVAQGGDRLGILRIQDISEGNTNPCFDLRLTPEARGKGLGTQCLRWLTAYVFDNFPQFVRMEGQTREDNLAMRRVFKRCGYVKEAHYRQGWPTGDGHRLDSTGYAILRDDWVSGNVTPVRWDDEI